MENKQQTNAIKKQQSEKKQRKFAKTFTKKSMTKQSHRKECDIKNLVDRHLRQGNTFKAPDASAYGDFSQVSDYHSAMNQIIQANNEFGLLPSKLRARFQNDPAQLIQFLSNPKNLPEAEKLGLVKIKKPSVNAEHSRGKPAATGGPETKAPEKNESTK